MADDITIFILDDEQPICTMMQSIMAALGLRTESATSLDKALSCVKRTHYDVVFLDVLLAESGGVCGPTKLLSEAKIAKPGPAVLGAALRDKREAAVGVR